MDKLGVWLGQAWQHAQDHWRDHLVPALVLGGIVFAMVMVGTVIVMAGVFIGAAADSEELMIALVLGLSFLFTVVFMIAYIPLTIGYIKGTLSLLRGGEFTVGHLFSGLRETPAALLAMTITMFGVFLGALFFYIPGLIVAVFLWFGLPLVADGHGPIEALKRSVELVKPVFWGLLVYQLLFGLVISVIAYIPFVGFLLVVPVTFIMIVIPYHDLCVDHGLEERPGDDGGRGEPLDRYEL